MPSLLPMKNEAVSPSHAETHTTAIVTTIDVVPLPAIAPASTTAVSPGNTRPTNAPVSRKASAPTTTYVHWPSESEMSSSACSRLIDGSASPNTW